MVHFINENMIFIITNDQGKRSIAKLLRKSFSLKYTKSTEKEENYETSSSSSRSSEEDKNAEEDHILRPHFTRTSTQKLESLTCDDVLFSILDMSVRTIEPIVLRIKNEALALKNLAMNLSSNESSDYHKRSHMAHEILNYFIVDLNNKGSFFRSLKKKKFISPKILVLLKFLSGRLFNSRMLL